MTPWELQMCANAAGQSRAQLAWLTAGLHRTKKMPELGELLKPYEPKIEGDIEQDMIEASLFARLNRMADVAEAQQSGD